MLDWVRLDFLFDVGDFLRMMNDDDDDDDDDDFSRMMMMISCFKSVMFQ